MIYVPFLSEEDRPVSARRIRSGFAGRCPKSTTFSTGTDALLGYLLPTIAGFGLHFGLGFLRAASSFFG